MELYSTLKEAVNKIDFRIIHWEFQKSDNIFDRNALLALADELEPLFNPEGINYYMACPDGEILLLLMREKQIMSLFEPYQMPEQKAEPNAAEPPEPKSEPAAEPESGPGQPHAFKFCSACGAPLKPGMNFCGGCGKRILP